MPKLMKISQYRREAFAKGSEPSIRTLRNWIDKDILQGKRFGEQYYVEIESQTPVNDLVNKVLAP